MPNSRASLGSTMTGVCSCNEYRRQHESYLITNTALPGYNEVNPPSVLTRRTRFLFFFFPMSCKHSPTDDLPTRPPSSRSQQNNSTTGTVPMLIPTGREGRRCYATLKSPTKSKSTAESPSGSSLLSESIHLLRPVPFH